MRRATVNTPTRKTTASMKIAMAKKAGPKWSAWATRARAITAPERMVRNMFTRPSDSWYVRARVASRLQCSVARICSAPDSIGRGGISVDIDPSLIAWKVARQVGQGLEPATFEKRRDAVMDVGDRVRVDERGRPDLDGRASRDKKLQRVFRARDAADPEHRNPDRPRRLVREMYGERPDRRPGQAAGAKAESWLVSVEVDRHADQGVNGAQRVGAGRLDGPSDDADVTHHRRELDPERKLGSSAHGLGHPGSGARVVA